MDYTRESHLIGATFEKIRPMYSLNLPARCCGFVLCHINSYSYQTKPQRSRPGPKLFTISPLCMWCPMAAILNQSWSAWPGISSALFFRMPRFFFSASPWLSSLLCLASKLERFYRIRKNIISSSLYQQYYHIFDDIRNVMKNETNLTYSKFHLHQVF